MKNNRIIVQLVWISIFFGTILAACQKEKKKSEDDVTLIEWPEHFPPIHYDTQHNPLTKEGIALGKKLFYDPILSVNSTVSCGTCHVPFDAFAQANHPVSHGVYDRLGKRNSPTLANLAWMTSFFFDGGVVDLDLQPIQPITAHEEMAQEFDKIPSLLSSNDEYRKMFKNAFGSDVITNTNLLKALSQFMITLVSANSKYDNVVKGNSSFTPQEQEGYQLFKTHCNHCHQEPLFTDFSFRNNGLVAMPDIDDKGRYEITRMDADLYKFKVPTLRNLQYTMPYMHDGRFTNLEQILEHYNSEIIDLYGTLDPKLKKTGVAIPLNDSEKLSLIAFLKTLNDKDFVTNANHSE